MAAVPDSGSAKTFLGWRESKVACGDYCAPHLIINFLFNSKLLKS